MSASGDVELCPHRVPKPDVGWFFADRGASVAPRQYRVAVIIDSRFCPDCLKARVDNLRKAFKLLVESSVKKPETPEQHASLTEALKLYYDDLREWL